MSIGSLLPSPSSLEKINDDNWSLSHALLECHYSLNRAWLEEGQILKKSNIDKIRHIPGMCMGQWICTYIANFTFHKLILT